MKTATAADVVELCLWCLSIFGFALLLFRLYWSKLAGTYRYLSIFAGAQLIQNLVLLWFYKRDHTHYAYVYLTTSPFVWLTYILVVLEVYNLALNHYQGIATLSRKMLHIVLVVALIGALITLMPENHETLKIAKNIATVSQIERGIVSSLVLFLLMIAGFLLWFPVQMTRNAVIHTALCCVFFLGIDASLFARDLSGFRYTRLASTTIMGVGTLCLFLWSVLLKRQNEWLEITTRSALRAQDSQRLSQQLDSINAALLKAVRK